MPTNKELELQFAADCKVIEMKHEYRDYTGVEKYGLITALSEDELTAKYGIILDSYEPYIVLDLAFGEVRDDYIRNEWKHEKRSKRSLSYGIDDEDFEAHHEEAATPDCFDAVLKNDEARVLWEAIRKLTPLQQQRLIKHFFMGKSSREIALEEGVNYSKIDNSIKGALEKLKKIMA